VLFAKVRRKNRLSCPSCRLLAVLVWKLSGISKQFQKGFSRKLIRTGPTLVSLTCFRDDGGSHGELMTKEKDGVSRRGIAKRRAPADAKVVRS
jgi:hypothetical protein